MESRNYIDREYILKTFDSLRYPYNNLDSAKGIVLNAPAADVAPRSEIAREIFADLREMVIPEKCTDGCACYLDMAELTELEKKYTEV